jgi:hypothetical protein
MEKGVRFDVKRHTATGLFVATSDEIPGFVVHAHTHEDLGAKLAPALKEWMQAIGRPISDVTVERDGLPGYEPAAFVAKGHLEAA